MTILTTRPAIVIQRSLQGCLNELPRLTELYGEPSDIHIQERHDDEDFWIMRVQWPEKVVI